MTTTINASTSSGLVTTPDNSGAIALQNAGVTGLNISATGQVTTPLQVMVSAGCNSGTVTDAIIVFNAVAINVGSAYNSTTGVFTAPVAGNYLVGCQLTANSTNTLNFSIRVNGTNRTISQTSNNAGSAAYQTLPISQILSLSVNDTVDFYANSSVYGGSEIFTNMYITLLG